MNRYSAQRKQAIINKMLSPDPVPVPQLAKEEGISDVTLYTWRKQARTERQLVSSNDKNPAKWSAEQRFACIVETASLTELELGQYCRKRGIYPEQLQQWKQDFIQGQQSDKQRQRAEQQQVKAEKQKVRKLEKELQRKDKALAETAALLVLQKKLNALWGESEDE